MKPRHRASSGTSRRRLRFKTDEEGNATGQVAEIADAPIQEPTEQELAIYKVINDSFVLGDDAARAVARFERDVVFPRYRENNESEEEFRKEEMDAVMGRLQHIHTIKAILPLFGLEKYEAQIVGHFIDQAFGSSSSGKPSTVFRGDDESYLAHKTMTTD